MKLYLERSRECALSAALYAGQSGWKVLQKDIAHWLYHIIPHLARVWRFTIGIRGEGMQTKELLAPLLEVSVPSLQRLEILHWPHGRTWEDPAHVVDVFWSAPRLTSLRMVGAILGLPVPSWVHSLTRLELRKADSGEFLAAIASQCLSLIHLHVELEDLLPSGQFHVPSIQSLYIGICPHGDEHYLSCMLDLFDTRHPRKAAFPPLPPHRSPSSDISRLDLPHLRPRILCLRRAAHGRAGLFAPAPALPRPNLSIPDRAMPRSELGKGHIGLPLGPPPNPHARSRCA
ncbi:hypothetical protein C8R46DRAFT_600882 [Mycena filopes]|nr:hypothetical protein C8R46DRAFT_600882 [Mycena filopes]